MELKRKIYNQLVEWKNKQHGKTAALIEGARRIGKSHIAVQFAKTEYKSYILIDFSKVTKQITDIFENDILDFDIFFTKLSFIYGVKLYKRQSLIIFDEVQKYPKARELIKHFVADGRYDFLETGSLITLKKNIEDIVLPSEEEHLKMYPLDFEEFLWALNDEVTLPYIKNCYKKMIPLGQSLHKKALTLFRIYMIVGGMPQAVLSYCTTKDFQKADESKRLILNLYREDISKFAKGYETKVKAIFDTIPSQLSHHEKKFSISSLSKNQRYRDYEDSFMWLSDAMVINQCFNTTDPNITLALNSEQSTMKCYLSDTGLLVSMALKSNLSTENELYKALLLDKLNINEGMFMENIVAQMLAATGHELYFYTSYDKANPVNRMEIDFLIIKDKKVCPIEVKSTNHFTHSSLDKFSAKFKRAIGTKYILSEKDLSVKDNIVYLPLYMGMLL